MGGFRGGEKVSSHEGADAVDLPSETSGVVGVGGEGEEGGVRWFFVFLRAVLLVVAWGADGALDSVLGGQVCRAYLHFLQAENSGPILPSEEVTERGRWYVIDFDLGCFRCRGRWEE